MSRKLSSSEKRLIAVAAVMFVIFIIYVVAKTGGGSTRTNDFSKLEADRAKLVSQVREYQEIKVILDGVDEKIKQTPENYDLLGELSKIGNELGITFKDLSPHESGGTDYYDESYVNVQINEISLPGLVKLLQKIDESPAFVRVSLLTVKRKSFKTDEPSPLEVNLRATVYSPKKEEASP